MTISVIIPVYNGEKYIGKCLEALAEQTCQPDEIIVVNDGSTDGSVAIAKEKSVNIISQENQGPAAARNTGIREARGDVILFTDCDCEPDPDWVMEMTDVLRDASVSGVKGAYATRQTGIVPCLVQYEFEERYDLMEKFPAIDFIDTYSAGFRHSDINEMGGFNASLIKNEDVDLSYRLARAGKKLIFNRKAVVYHHHPENWWAYFYSKVKKAYWRTIVYWMHPRKAIKDTYTPQLLKIQIFLALLALLSVFPALLWSSWVWIDVGLWIGLMLSTIPFLLRVSQKGLQLIFGALIFIILRSFAFLIGVFWGICGLIFIKPIDRHPAH